VGDYEVEIPILIHIRGSRLHMESVFCTINRCGKRRLVIETEITLIVSEYITVRRTVPKPGNNIVVLVAVEIGEMHIQPQIILPVGDLGWVEQRNRVQLSPVAIAWASVPFAARPDWVVRRGIRSARTRVPVAPPKANTAVPYAVGSL
jgi:hypothetical protein